MTFYGDEGNETYGDHFIIYTNIESQCCIPEANVTLQVNHTSRKDKVIFLLRAHV